MTLIDSARDIDLSRLGTCVWTDPYFDSGDGEVWMITRSVPVRDAEGIFAVITTDPVVGVPTR